MTSFCKKNFKKWARVSLTCCCSPVTTLVWKCLKMGFSSVVVANVDTNYHFWILMFDLLFFSATAQTEKSPSTLEAKPPTTNEKWEREREKVCVFVCAWKRKRKRGFFVRLQHYTFTYHTTTYGLLFGLSSPLFSLSPSLRHTHMLSNNMKYLSILFVQIKSETWPKILWHIIKYYEKWFQRNLLQA